MELRDMLYLFRNPSIFFFIEAYKLPPLSRDGEVLYTLMIKVIAFIGDVLYRIT